MKIFFVAYLISTAMGAAALLIFNSQFAAISFVAGACLMMLNVAALGFAWSRVLRKKGVALPVGVIVIKYAILGFILYRVASENLLNVPWFAAGVSLVVVSAVGSTLFAVLRAPKD